MSHIHNPTNLAKRNVGTGRDLSEASPLEGSCRPTRKGFTPPLRGSQQDEGEARSRAGGGTSHRGKSPPTTSAFAQTARLLSVFPRGKTDPLKGGVKFKNPLRSGSTPMVVLFRTGPWNWDDGVGRTYMSDIYAACLVHGMWVACMRPLHKTATPPLPRVLLDRALGGGEGVVRLREADVGAERDDALDELLGREPLVQHAARVNLDLAG